MKQNNLILRALELISIFSTPETIKRFGQFLIR